MNFSRSGKQYVVCSNSFPSSLCAIVFFTQAHWRCVIGGQSEEVLPTKSCNYHQGSILFKHFVYF